MPNESTKRDVDAVASDEEKDAAAGENGNKRRRTSGTEAEVIELNPDCGTMVVAGGTNWDLIGRKELPKGAKAPPPGRSTANMWGPHVWKENMRVRAIGTSCTACHSGLVTEDGKVYTWGRNESGQLGVGDTETRYEPTLIKELTGQNIVKIATGRSHTLFLNDKGVVFSCGANKMGQLGLGSEGKNQMTPEKIKYSGKPIVKMACGAEFSMILDVAGGLYSFGSPEYGQLGHNTDGASLERAGKATYTPEPAPRLITRFVEKNKSAVTPIPHVMISDMKCGVNHTIASDTTGRVFTWGFGGYGRLGHAESKDELVPRLVNVLENLKVYPSHIAAGSTMCLVSNARSKMAYFWGQLKMSGEATMYPKAVHDLAGWNVENMGCCNKSMIVLADDSVITWGPTPTYGELLYDSPHVKSATSPQEAKPMSGISCQDLACGFGHVLLIAKDTTEEQRQKLSLLPKWPASV